MYPFFNSLCTKRMCSCVHVVLQAETITRVIVKDFSIQIVKLAIETCSDYAIQCSSVFIYMMHSLSDSDTVKFNLYSSKHYGLYINISICNIKMSICMNLSNKKHHDGITA